MIHVVCFSGGKDSTALVLWAKEHLDEFRTVFCDTGWEHPQTLAYVQEINQRLLGGSLIVLQSEGMRNLVSRKMRVPSACARFCTEQLKVKPMKAYLESLEDEVTIYQGVRADESWQRRDLPRRSWDDHYDCWIERPLIDWTAEQVFEQLQAHGIPPNPLYLQGSKRVGCFPCVLISHRELKSITPQMPEIWDRAQELEDLAGRSFFGPNAIPVRFHSGWDPKSEKSFPTVSDVRVYIESRADFPEGPPRSCVSHYNLCE